MVVHRDHQSCEASGHLPVTPGARLDKWYTRYDPCLGRVLQAIVRRRISRVEMLGVADELEQAARELRAIVNGDNAHDTEHRRATD